MDIGNSYSKTKCSTMGASIIVDHFTLDSQVGLGKFTSFKSNVIILLYYFVFDKTKGKVVKKSYKKPKISGVLELTITTRTLLMAETRTNSIFIAFVGVSFSQYLEFNIWNMTK
jgi:hypothetical protein